MNNLNSNECEAHGSEGRSSCECCRGVEKLTPSMTVNRPGLSGLSYRVGTHASFFETMQARLSGFWLELPRENQQAGEFPEVDRTLPLNDLTSRDRNDPAIALLDAWAMVGDVLTFYQERIANEGYLRTATERRSLLELVRLIGYVPRPGVSASVHLALNLEKGSEIVLKPYELKAQSVPGPGELPQTFENNEEIDAREAWNALKPRVTQPQTEETIKGESEADHRVYLKGIATNLNVNDPLLIDFGNKIPEPFRVVSVEPDTLSEKTRVGLKRWVEKRVFRGAHNRAELLELIDRLTGEMAPHSAGVTIEHTLKLLGRLRERIDAGAENVELAKHISDDLLIELRERETHLPTNAIVVRPILKNVIGELDATAARLAERTNREVDRAAANAAGSKIATNLSIGSVMAGLSKPPSIPPTNTLNLSRNIATHFAANGDTGLQVLSAFQPSIRESLGPAIAAIPANRKNTIRVYALRVKAQPFGNSTPLRSQIVEVRDDHENELKRFVRFFEWGEADIAAAEDESGSIIFLNGSFEKISPGSWVVVDTSQVDPKKEATVKPPEEPLLIARVAEVNASLSRAAYGMTGPVTRIRLADRKDLSEAAKWMRIEGDKRIDEFNIIRRTVVFAQSEELPLADEPIPDDVCGGSEIELDGLYSELKSGRWMIISGERADIKDASGKTIPGVEANELVMLDAVSHRINDELPGEQIHTFIKLASDLRYCYRRDGVTIYANVVKATHGETRNEILGSGDATKAFQTFNLRQPPLSYVASPTPSGAESTLQVFVNDVRWKEVPLLADAAPSDRKFVTQIADNGKTSVTFGDGRRGSRLPTGVENVRAIYRNGIGKPGNVDGGQISLLLTRPLGIKDVINPIRASGGADKEGPEQLRENAPLTVTALDRLVSTTDYADFARTFAGIGKAVAARFSDGRRELVHITIAGVDNIPIEESSDLFQNLRRAIREFGDPFQPFKVELRESKFLMISARIQIHPDHLWDRVVTRVRAKLLDRFSFGARKLGQDALLGEAVSVIQSVKGVEYVDVDLFGGLPEKRTEGNTRRLLTPEEILAEVQKLKGAEPRVPADLAGVEKGVIHPAELVYLTPDVPETLILNRI